MEEADGCREVTGGVGIRPQDAGRHDHMITGTPRRELLEGLRVLNPRRHHSAPTVPGHHTDHPRFVQMSTPFRFVRG